MIISRPHKSTFKLSAIKYSPCIYFLVPILGHPVYQFLQKHKFSDLTVSGIELPWCMNVYNNAGQICMLWSMLWRDVSGDGSIRDTSQVVMSQTYSDNLFSLSSIAKQMRVKWDIFKKPLSYVVISSDPSHKLWHLNLWQFKKKFTPPPIQ